MKLFNSFVIVLVILFICMALCLSNLYKLSLIEMTMIEKELEEISINDIEIKKLQDTQNQWIEQTELLTIVNQLGISVQTSELNNKELVNALDKIIKENEQLNFEIQKSVYYVNNLLEIIERLEAREKST